MTISTKRRATHGALVSSSDFNDFHARVIQGDLPLSGHVPGVEQVFLFILCVCGQKEYVGMCWVCNEDPMPERVRT